MEVADVKVENLQDLLAKYPNIMNILKAGYFRQYHLQDALLITSTEVDIIVATLINDSIIKTTPFGYKMTRKVQDACSAKGVKFNGNS